MLMRIFGELGAWNWIVLGLVLLALEIVMPGVFLLWIGIAAILTGAMSLQLWDFSFWVWEVQVLVFLVVALVSVFVGNRIMKHRLEETDEPLLNRRAEQLVGRTAVLDEPIAEGRGRIRIGDTVWKVRGPDVPAATRVRVTGADGSELIVDPLQDAAR
jgi:inner membrane protein